MLPDELLKMHLVIRLELLLSVVALILAFLLPRKYTFCFRRSSHILSRFARNKNVVLLCVALIAFMGSMTVSLLVRFPQPAVHDEFSYLLAADTFALGRLSNPAHELWNHFESFHVIQQPSYASKFPPAQGLILALGQILGGHPIVGVWLSMAMACAAICWMLQAWVPQRWALIGGTIASLNLGFFGYWSQKYWGGAMATLGGALLFGALRRLTKKPSTGISLTLALGIAILANSRPLEGMIAAMPVIAFLAIYIFRSPIPIRFWLGKVVIPSCFVLLVCAVLMAIYNHAVTGDFWMFPYSLYQATHASTPLFLWSKKTEYFGDIPKIFIDHIHHFENQLLDMQSISGFLVNRSAYLIVITTFFLRFVFVIPLLTIPYLRKNRWNLFALSVIGSVACICLLQVQAFPRKMAPVTCLIVLISVQSLRYMMLWKPYNIPAGRRFTFLLLLTFFISVVSCFHPYFHNSPWLPSRLRAQLIRELNNSPHRHVILVRYSADHNPHFEWVYNSANIDDSKIIWAHELDIGQNQRLIEYYHDRKIWLLEADCWMKGEAITLIPYSSPCPNTTRCDNNMYTP